MSDGIRYRSYVVIPLRWKKAADWDEPGDGWAPVSLTLGDLTHQGRRLFAPGDDFQIGTCWKMDAETLLRRLFGPAGANREFTVGETQKSPQGSFSLVDAYLYSFKSGLAFFCLGVAPDQPSTVYRFVDFGFFEAQTKAWPRGGQGLKELTPALEEWLRRAGLKQFFENKDRLLLDVSIYNLALQKGLFNSLQPIQAAVRDLHLEKAIGTGETDEAQEDEKFVFAAKNNGTYRWGCCITSQTMNLIYGGLSDDGKEREQQFTDCVESDLPLMIIALQQRFMCYALTDEMALLEDMSSRRKIRLQHRMTDFIAFGTLSPSTLSRWNNVKAMYRYLLEMMDTETAISDITEKLNMLIRNREKGQKKRLEITGVLFAIFGFASIPSAAVDLYHRFFPQDDGAHDTLIIFIVLALLLLTVVYMLWSSRWLRRFRRWLGLRRREKAGNS